MSEEAFIIVLKVLVGLVLAGAFFGAYREEKYVRNGAADDRAQAMVFGAAKGALFVVLALAMPMLIAGGIVFIVVL